MDRFSLCLPDIGLGIAMEILFWADGAGGKRLEWKRSDSPTRRVSPKILKIISSYVFNVSFKFS